MPWARAPAPTATPYEVKFRRWSILLEARYMEGWTMIFSLKDEGLLHRIPPSRRLFPLLLAVPFVGFLAGCSEPDQTNARNAATTTTASIQMPPPIVADRKSVVKGKRVSVRVDH